MAFNIGKYAEALERPGQGAQDVETLKAEYLRHRKNGGNAILGMGNCLIGLKAQLPHGEWLAWLEEVECKERDAQRLMRLAREFSNPTALSDLGKTKALQLLMLPPEEREPFLAETHMVGGEEKSVADMTSRELEKAIRERDEARMAAEAAKADAQAAEESRAKMEADMQMLSELHRDAQEGAAKTREALAKARAELKELREKPVEVAVEEDKEAVARARAEAIAEMEEKFRQAQEAREEAEAALKEARRQLESAGRRDEPKTSRRKRDLAVIAQARFQADTSLNQLHGVILKSMGRDEATAEEARRVLLDLADYARRCAE